MARKKKEIMGDCGLELKRHPQEEENYEELNQSAQTDDTAEIEEALENFEMVSEEEVNELWGDDAGNIKYEERRQKELDSALENIDKDLAEDSYAEEIQPDDEEQADADAEEDVQEPAEKGEVLAETKEEKRMLQEKNAKLKEIQELEEKNNVLEKEAEKFDYIASTISSEPFIELKSLVKEAIKTYVDRDDDKEAQKKFKNFKALCQMQNLLTEYRNLAEGNRQNITANEQEIENMKNRIDEIDSKLHNFQKKLDIDTETEQISQN